MKKAVFIVEHDIYEKFMLVVNLKGEKMDSVIEIMMKQFIMDNLANISMDFNTNKKLNNRRATKNEFEGKANNRIPKWAFTPNQYNHRIIRAFFEIESNFGFVTLETLEKKCINPRNSNLYVPTFKSNYAQMKFDGPKSHGKVFVDDGEIVEIWDEIRSTLMEFKSHFINQ